MWLIWKEMFGPLVLNLWLIFLVLIQQETAGSCADQVGIW